MRTASTQQAESAEIIALAQSSNEQICRVLFTAIIVSSLNVSFGRSFSCPKHASYMEPAFPVW